MTPEEVLALAKAYIESLHSQGLLIPAVATLASLVLIVLVLAFATPKKKRSAKSRSSRLDGEDVAKGAAGSEYVEQDGMLLRRSTRARKPPALAAAIAEASKTPRKTPAKATSAAAAKTPSKGDVQTTPRRSTRTPKA